MQEAKLVENWNLLGPQGLNGIEITKTQRQKRRQNKNPKKEKKRKEKDIKPKETHKSRRKKGLQKKILYNM